MSVYRVWFSAWIALFIILFIILGCSQGARAQLDPLIGHDQFPQFRNLSGLSGGGYGVDEHGFRSLSGPTAFSTPVANTLGHDQVHLATASLSFNSAPQFSANHSNFTGIATYGHTFGSVVNATFTVFFLSTTFDSVYNAQFQYIPQGRNTHLTGSLGIQNLRSKGSASGQGRADDSQSSQSLFGVLTYRVDTRHNPVYVSAGFGTRRFGKGFASASYQALKPLRAYVEYDGYGFNEGVLLSYRTGPKHRDPEFNVGAGYVRGRYFGASLGLGF